MFAILLLLLVTRTPLSAIMLDGGCPLVPPTTEISHLISFESKLILGVPVLRPSFLFVEHNWSSHDESYNFEIVPEGKWFPYCVKLTKDFRGTQLESFRRRWTTKPKPSRVLWCFSVWMVNLYSAITERLLKKSGGGWWVNF